MFDLSNGMLKSPCFNPLFIDKNVTKHKNQFLVIKVNWNRKNEENDTTPESNFTKYGVLDSYLKLFWQRYHKICVFLIFHFSNFCPITVIKIMFFFSRKEIVTTIFVLFAVPKIVLYAFQYGAGGILSWTLDSVHNHVASSAICCPIKYPIPIRWPVHPTRQASRDA